MTWLPVPLRRFHPAGVAARSRVRRRLDRATRGRRVLVAGSRRSGNHAVIAWLASALAGAAVTLHYSDWRVGATAGNRVVHCNDLPRHPGSLRFGDLDRAVRRITSNGPIGDLVVSYEDVRVDELTAELLVVPTIDVRILVTRPLLDLVASRIGGSRVGFAVDEHWLETEVANRTALPDGWETVRFDRWLLDPAYRIHVLDRIGGSVDELPDRVAPMGGGSTFSGRSRIPRPSELVSRREQVAWPPSLVALLLDPRFRALLDDDEVAWLEGVAR